MGGFAALTACECFVDLKRGYSHDFSHDIINEPLDEEDVDFYREDMGLALK